MSTPAIINKRYEDVGVDTLTLHPRNPRQGDVGAIFGSLEASGFFGTIVVQESTGHVLVGNHRLQAAKAAGMDQVPVVFVDVDDKTALRIMLADNRTAELADNNDATLAELLQELQADGMLDGTGYDGDDLDALLADLGHEGDGGGDGKDAATTTLQERFLVPPFTVLDARQGYWRDRKRAWVGLGLKSELGRDAEAFHQDSLNRITDQRQGGKYKGRPKHGADVKQAADGSLEYAPQTGVSVFDPVLCELAYRWFAPAGGLVLDPFAGGSVRGVVAARLGHPYHGIDLRAEQVEANREQWKEIGGGVDPTWYAGDSNVVLDGSDLPDAVDLVFTCPPYADLEVYSDDPADISNMSYDDFRSIYASIIGKACARLADDRFACIVVGDVRGKDGTYRNFVAHTTEAFEAAGLSLYNEAVLVTPVGSMPVRAAKAFTSSRKLSKGHQNVLVYVKGDAKKAHAACGVVEIPDAALPEVEAEA